MGDAHAPLQSLHRLRVEHVAHQAVALVHAQVGAVGGGDAGGVLATVLEHGEAVVELGRDVMRRRDAKDAAHVIDLRNPRAALPSPAAARATPARPATAPGPLAIGASPARAASA